MRQHTHRHHSGGCLKRKIFEHNATPVEQQRLILSGGGKSKELKDGDLLRGFHAREGFFHDSEYDDASEDDDVSKLHFPEYKNGEWSVGRLDLQILPPRIQPCCRRRQSRQISSRAIRARATAAVAPIRRRVRTGTCARIIVISRCSSIAALPTSHTALRNWTTTSWVTSRKRTC